MYGDVSQDWLRSLEHCCNTNLFRNQHIIPTVVQHAFCADRQDGVTPSSSIRPTNHVSEKLLHSIGQDHRALYHVHTLLLTTSALRLPVPDIRHDKDTKGHSRLKRVRQQAPRRISVSAKFSAWQVQRPQACSGGQRSMPSTSS